MPIPSTMADLSTTAGTNSPAGSDSPTSGDDYLRSIQAIIRTTNAKGVDIVSATTTDIGAATGEFVDVTGTTTITGLGTIAAGIVRTVRFTGALTLTHNATSLILPGSANITTANGDVAQFRSLGSGNWKCVSYIKQDGTSIVSSITDKSVTYAKIQDISATKRVLGRNTAGAGVTEEVTLTQLLDWIGTAAQGDILYRDSASWGRLAAGTSGQFLKTQGSAANPIWANAVTTQLVTDSTDILLNNYATPSYNNVGSSFSVNIPANGSIKLSSITARVLNNATATAHNVVFGIRISTTNYWFGYLDRNGTISASTVLSGLATASVYSEFKGTPTNSAFAIDVSANSVPTGAQTVQLIAAYDTTQSTLKGTTTQTRVVLEFIG